MGDREDAAAVHRLVADINIQQGSADRETTIAQPADDEDTDDD